MNARLLMNLPAEEFEKIKEKESSRAKKWIWMMKNWESHFNPVRNTLQHNKIRRRVRKGIPECMRGFAWYALSDGDSIMAKLGSPYSIDTSTLPQQTVDEIERDIDRTFPRHVMFIENEGIGQQSLRRLLQWYAVLDPEVGYCQGMGFLAGLFLQYMPEDKAFYCLYSVLQVLSTTDLPFLYENSFYLANITCLETLCSS